MTSKAYMPLMWAYYGNHQGCCVGFDIPEGRFRAVEYIKEFENHEEMSNDEIVESLYRKGHEWDHEKEFRAVYSSTNYDEWKIVGNDVFYKAKVKNVIFGYRAHLAEGYKDALEYLQGRDVQVLKCKLKSNRYEFTGNRQFDVNLELKRIEENR